MTTPEPGPDPHAALREWIRGDMRAEMFEDPLAAPEQVVEEALTELDEHVPSIPLDFEPDELLAGYREQIRKAHREPVLGILGITGVLALVGLVAQLWMLFTAAVLTGAFGMAVVWSVSSNKPDEGLLRCYPVLVREVHQRREIGTGEDPFVFHVHVCSTPWGRFELRDFGRVERGGFYVIFGPLPTTPDTTPDTTLDTGLVPLKWAYRLTTDQIAERLGPEG